MCWQCPGRSSAGWPGRGERSDEVRGGMPGCRSRARRVWDTAAAGSAPGWLCHLVMLGMNCRSPAPQPGPAAPRSLPPPQGNGSGPSPAAPEAHKHREPWGCPAAGCVPADEHDSPEQGATAPTAPGQDGQTPQNRGIAAATIYDVVYSPYTLKSFFYTRGNDFI